jgi:hypothetical protein
VVAFLNLDRLTVDWPTLDVQFLDFFGEPFFFTRPEENLEVVCAFDLSKENFRCNNRKLL